MGKVAGAQGGARKGTRLPPQVQERVKAARLKAKAGDFTDACELFAKLAEKAHERGRHRMALHMALRTAFNQGRAGNDAATYGAPIQNQTAVGRRFGRLVHQLNKADLDGCATAVEAQALQLLGLTKLPRGEGANTVNRARRRKLPKACPTCAAPVEIEAVEFDDEGADCPDCGGELLR